MQTCVLHLLRNTLRLSSRRDWDKMASDLRPVHTAVNEADAAARLDKFHTIWANRYPAIKSLSANAWSEFVPFLDYSPEIGRVISSMNGIETVRCPVFNALHYYDFAERAIGRCHRPLISARTPR